MNKSAANDNDIVFNKGDMIFATYIERSIGIVLRADNKNKKIKIYWYTPSVEAKVIADDWTVAHVLPLRSREEDSYYAANVRNIKSGRSFLYKVGDFKSLDENANNPTIGGVEK